MGPPEKELGPARCVRAGRCSGGSVAVAAAGARPDEAEAFAFLVVEEVGVDRSVEARVVQLETEIGAALVGGLGPGGADLGSADKDAVAWGVLADLAALGDAADGLGLKAPGEDFAGEFVAGLFEGADGRHGSSP